MKIAIGADHAGFEYKQQIINYLQDKGFEVKDFGAYSEESVDYPDFAHPVCEAIEKNEFDQGVLICGSGNGISISANKHQGIRSAICWNATITELARQHNNANVLTLPARFISIEEALNFVNIFFATEFEGGRHERRVSKIPC